MGRRRLLRRTRGAARAVRRRHERTEPPPPDRQAGADLPARPLEARRLQERRRGRRRRRSGDQRQRGRLVAAGGLAGRRRLRLVPDRLRRVLGRPARAVTSSSTSRRRSAACRRSRRSATSIGRLAVRVERSRDHLERERLGQRHRLARPHHRRRQRPRQPARGLPGDAERRRNPDEALLLGHVHRRQVRAARRGPERPHLRRYPGRSAARVRRADHRSRLLVRRRRSAPRPSGRRAPRPR